MARTLENTGYRWEVYHDDFLVAHIVPHDSRNRLVARRPEGPCIQHPKLRDAGIGCGLSARTGTTAYNVVQRGTAGKAYWCIEVRSKSTRVTCGQPHSTAERMRRLRQHDLTPSRYIERVRSDDKVVFCPVEQPTDITAFPRRRE